MPVSAQWETCPQAEWISRQHIDRIGTELGGGNPGLFHLQATCQAVQSYIYMFAQSSVGLDTIHREEVGSHICSILTFLLPELS